MATGQRSANATPLLALSEPRLAVSKKVATLAELFHPQWPSSLREITSLMRQNTLSRYQRTDDNRVMVEIDAGSIKDLYNDFDKHAPYVRKELDAGLVDYLIESVTEIGKEDFIIQFRLAQLEDDNLMERVKISIHNYFLYLVEREHREVSRMLRTSLIYFIIGIVILFLSFWINHQITDHDTFIAHVLTEGLNVAAWVSLWTAIATFLINWVPQRNIIKVYKRISHAPIFFVADT